MFGIHPVFLIILLVVVLIIFGPGRLPELGGAIGKGIREFRKATDDIKGEVTRAVEEPHRDSTPAGTTTPEPAKTESESPKS